MSIDKVIEKTVAATVKALLVEYCPPTVEWLNTEQAAVYTGFSKEYLEICRHKDDGSGPEYIKHPRVVRYHRSDLDAWMEEHRHGRPRPLEQRTTRRRSAAAQEPRTTKVETS